MEELILVLPEHEDHLLFWKQMFEVTPSSLKAVGAIFLAKDLDEQDQIIFQKISCEIARVQIC